MFSFTISIQMLGSPVSPIWSVNNHYILHYLETTLRLKELLFNNECRVCVRWYWLSICDPKETSDSIWSFHENEFFFKNELCQLTTNWKHKKYLLTSYILKSIKVSKSHVFRNACKGLKVSTRKDVLCLRCNLRFPPFYQWCDRF